MIGQITNLKFIAILCTILFLVSSSANLLLAHNFSSDESASFLSLVDQIKSAVSPIKGDISSNMTLARNHVQYAKMLLSDNAIKELEERNHRIATELPKMLDSLQNGSVQNISSALSTINALIAEAVTARIDKDQLNNSTIQGLTLASDVNKILDGYMKAFATVSDNRGGLNNTAVMKMNEDDLMNKGMNINGTMSLSDLGAYQRALALTDIVIKRFNKQINDKGTISNLEPMVNVLDQLKTSLLNKEPPTNIMTIVHGQIHPNLQTAFGLELISSPGQMTKNMSKSMPNSMSTS